jgi:hypothetical protein
VLLAATFVWTSGCAVPDGAQGRASAPVTIQKQGSFSVGGKTLGDEKASLHCDHGYAEYQIPARPRRTNLVMWHSAAASAWMNRWDGGEGFQSLFLRRGYPVYIWDGPQVGRANWGCTDHAYTAGTGRDQRNFTSWRFGAQYLQWFDGVQFPTRDAEAWNQAARARYLEFDSVENAQLQSDAAAKLSADVDTFKAASAAKDATIADLQQQLAVFQNDSQAITAATQAIVDADTKLTTP